MNGLRTMRIKDVRIIVDEDTYNELRGLKLKLKSKIPSIKKRCEKYREDN